MISNYSLNNSKDLQHMNDFILLGGSWIMDLQQNKKSLIIFNVFNIINVLVSC